MLKIFWRLLANQAGQVADGGSEPTEAPVETSNDQGGTTETASQDDSYGLRVPYESTDETQPAPADPTTAVQQPATDPLKGTFAEGDLNLDPTTWTPEQQAVFKKMQSSYTKKMQAAAGFQEKASIVDRFNSDPQFAFQTVQDVAARNGYKLVPINSNQGGAQQVANPSVVDMVKSKLPQELQWMSEPHAAATQAVVESILQPLVEQLKQQETSRAESQYDEAERAFAEKNPGWEEHEDKMAELHAFLKSPALSHPEFGSKHQLLLNLVTGNGAAVAQAVKRVNAAAGNKTFTQGSARPVAQKPIQDDVATTEDRNDAWSKATRFALSQQKRRH